MTSASPVPVPVITTAAAGRRRSALVVLCFVQFMLVLDDTVVSVALPSIRDDLGFGATGLAWVVNAYFLAFGGLLLLFGRMADLLGRRRVFLTGVALFGVASLACGLAQQPWQLVAGRSAQGAGAAMAGPAALSLITLLYPGTEERAKALGVWGGVAGLGGTAGLVISGALTGLTSWRWIFLINLPVAVVALALLPHLVAESRATRRARLDVPGAVLGTAAVSSLVYGLLRAGESGWGDVAVTVPLLLAVVLAVAFLVVESRTPEPLVPLSLLSVRTRAVANGAALLFSAAFYAMAFLLMIHLQTVLGYGPLEAGIAYLPYGAGILAGMWLSSRAAMRLGMRRALVLSFLVSSGGLLLLSGVAPGDHYAAGVLPGMLVTSLGCGLSLPVLTAAALTGTTEENAGLGSAVLTSVQQVGGAVGLAVLVALAALRSDGSADPARSATEGFSDALTVAAALLALGAVLVATLLHRGGMPAGGRAGQQLGSPPMAYVDEQGRTRPPLQADEIATLLGFLDYQRATLAWKCAGLDAAGLQASVGPSEMTLGGMLKHMAYVEDAWFSRRLHGQDLQPPWDRVDWQADRDWEWHSAADDTPEQLRTLWADTVTRSRALAAEALADGGLDQPARRTWPDGRAPSLRWILVHMIEEYARHNGHADLIRESVDGSTGD